MNENTNNQHALCTSEVYFQSELCKLVLGAEERSGAMTRLRRTRNLRKMLSKAGNKSDFVKLLCFDIDLIHQYALQQEHYVQPCGKFIFA